MRRSVDPTRQAADHGQTSISYLVGEFFSGLSSIMGGAARADNANCVIVALLKVTPNVKHDRRSVNFPERLWIRW